MSPRKPQDSTGNAEPTPNAAATPEAKVAFVLPAGFTYAKSEITTGKAVVTDADKADGTPVRGKLTYEVEYPDSEDVNAVREFYKSKGIDGDAVLLRAWRELQKQRAKTGGLAAVNKAANIADRDKAVGAHKAYTREAIIWSRERKERASAKPKVAGLTAKQRQAFGEATLALMMNGTPTQADFLKAAYMVGVRGAENFAQLHLPEPSAEQCSTWDAESKPVSEAAPTAA